MSKDLNKCMFIGRLGQDPEVKYTQAGSCIANISLACGDDYKDKNSGQTVEQTEWVRVVFFSRLAEVVGEYLRKGSQVYVEGKMRTRKWQDQQGQDRYTTEIVANEMQMLGSKTEAASGGGDYRPTPSGAGGHRAAAPPQRPAPPPQGQPQGVYNANQPAPQGGYDAFDEEIPF